MDAQWTQQERSEALGLRVIRLAKAAAALHMTEASRLRAHMLRPGDAGFEWSGELTVSEFEVVFGVRSHPHAQGHRAAHARQRRHVRRAAS